MHITGTNVALRNCIFEYNIASMRHGGAIYWDSSAQEGDSYIENCKFHWNRANDRHSISQSYGGAIHFNMNSNSISITRSTFQGKNYICSVI